MKSPTPVGLRRTSSVGKVEEISTRENVCSEWPYISHDKGLLLDHRVYGGVNLGPLE